MYLVVGLGIFAASIAVYFLADLIRAVFLPKISDRIWEVFVWSAIVALFGSVAIWCLRLTLPMVFA